MYVLCICVYVLSVRGYVSVCMCCVCRCAMYAVCMRVCVYVCSYKDDIGYHKKVVVVGMEFAAQGLNGAGVDNLS